MSDTETPTPKSTIEQDLRNLINHGMFTGVMLKSFQDYQNRPATSAIAAHVERFVEPADTLPSLFAKLRDLDAQREIILTKIARLRGEE